ncbi:MAG: SUMF1/EgtB/PvdO family nonheme iron enzyme [Treponema sp.]|nr:SUMF1/EgtB/PvdO family nonheme iron enzyme [Treponema sp.]
MAGSPLRKIRFGKKLEIKDQDRVTLPVILGIKPPVYLAVLYGMGILAVLFLLLIYPGIIKPGAAGIFISEPQGAAVRIDDITLGYTPCRVFIPQGKHSIEFVLPGFTVDRQELQVKGRIFASLFFPAKINIAGNLVCPDPAGTLASSALEYMYWAAAGEPTERFQNPMCLSEGLYRVGPTAKDPSIRKSMQGILDYSLRYAVTRASARDLLRAQFLLDNNGLSPSQLTVIHSLQKIVSKIGSNSASALWLSEILPGGFEGKFLLSDWFANDNGFQSNTGSFDFPVQVPSFIDLEALNFILADTGYLEKFNRREILPPMFISRFLVSQEAWDLFTREKSEWAAENRGKLIERGLVGEDYLVRLDNPGYPEQAVSGISWYAAKAYCEWLNTKLPASLSGWEIRLPSEAEWEYTAYNTNLDIGLLWEWCADPFAPLNFFPVNDETLAIFERTALPAENYPLERVLRGGSWINNPGTSDMESRGSLPPGTSSPFAGFRPVITPKRGD